MKDAIYDGVGDAWEYADGPEYPAVDHALDRKIGKTNWAADERG